MHAQVPQDKATPLPGPEPVAALARLPRKSYSFTLIPEADALGALCAALDLRGLRKVRLVGHIAPIGEDDWQIDARLGATVVQPCTVTLAPVTTRIDEDITRRYVADWSMPEDGAETEMPEDDTTEPLPQSLDLRDVLHEALSLALPLYPRAEGAGFDSLQTAPPGVAPMRDEDTKPFAGLAALRNRLSSGEDTDTD